MTDEITRKQAGTARRKAIDAHREQAPVPKKVGRPPIGSHARTNAEQMQVQRVGRCTISALISISTRDLVDDLLEGRSISKWLEDTIISQSDWKKKAGK